MRERSSSRSSRQAAAIAGSAASPIAASARSRRVIVARRARASSACTLRRTREPSARFVNQDLKADHGVPVVGPRSSTRSNQSPVPVKGLMGDHANRDSSSASRGFEQSARKQRDERASSASTVRTCLQRPNELARKSAHPQLASSGSRLRSTVEYGLAPARGRRVVQGPKLARPLGRLATRGFSSRKISSRRPTASIAANAIPNPSLP